MKKKLMLAFLLILFLVLDNSFIPFFAVRGYYPSLLFVFAICYSIINEDWSGLWIGMFSGMLQDLYFFKGFGVNTFLNILLCVTAAQVGKSLFKEKSLIPIITVFILTVVKGVGIFTVLYMLGVYSHIEVALFNGVYNLVIAVIMYRRVYNLCQKPYMMKTWKF
ncbi:MAG: rod shape-determining protein MreD [Bacillota bacterium]|nr:rod shape-determining protein MreD [Bacillota bacterium]